MERYVCDSPSLLYFHWFEMTHNLIPLFFKPHVKTNQFV